MGIPKIIHYCWFGGGEKSDLIKKCMKSWDILNDYQIIEWNEDNFDINSHEYVKLAYEQKKYAFVSDYVRLKVLKEYGGIYLDTDVEVKKSFNQFLSNDLFVGFMYDSLLGTAVIGATKNNIHIKNLLNKYNQLKLVDEANNNLFTKYFLDSFPTFRLNNSYQLLDSCVAIYPKEYFERPTYFNINHYSEHHYSATWKKNNKFKKMIKNILKIIIGNVTYRKIMHYISLKYTPYYEIYLLHKKKS